MRRILIGLACLVMLVGLAAGFNVPVESKGTVKLSFWVPGEGNNWVEYWRSAVKEFEAANPNIRVELTVTPSNGLDIETKLNAAKLSGTYPDVFAAYLMFLGSRGARNEFANLGGYVNRWDGKTDLFDSVYELGKYKGKLIGLGYCPSPTMLAYRKDYFQEAGLDPNKPPATWEELANDAIKLTKKDEKGNIVRAGFDLPVTDAFTFPISFIRQNGAMFVDEKKQQPRFNDPAAAEAIQFLADLYAKKISIPFDFQKGDTFPFMSGRAAMSFLTPTQIAKFMESNPTLKDKMAIAPVLKRKVKSAFSGYRLFVIGKNSKFKNEDWALIKFLMSKEQMKKRMLDIGTPVIRKSMTQDFIKLAPANKTILEYVEFGKGQPVVPWVSLYMKYAEQAYEEALNQKKTAQQALNDAQNALEDELQKFNL